MSEPVSVTLHEHPTSVQAPSEDRKGRLAGRVCVITGAARGQGRVEAVRMAQEGADLILVDLAGPVETIDYPMPTPADLEETGSMVAAAGGRCITAVVDVRDVAGLEHAIRLAVARFGRLDVVVANAGVLNSPKPTWELSESEWQTVIDINLTGVWATLKATIPHMIDAGNAGSIVIISSIAGGRGCPNVAPYVSAKHGVVGLARTAANELAAHRIRVNTVHPTNVRTPLIDNAVSARIFRPDMAEPTLDDGVVPLQRVNLMDVPWVSADDIADAVLFLASDDSKFITGASIPVDAGSWAKWPG
jgi:SDR family mycofactocin-dependent oxidoreductase